ncbi:MAG: hypothetical protein F4X14_21115 [Caldilineaceae bacterium SB0661_bin_32]|uniref:Uncharacterized protein n=1 Tax=Caldilineaceae bacterium SB0661_bin_32 TaxID=2605255 RepID=A0A6B1DDG2_9CHLR|nr:hypothetical protein [Caldilineaceae bacterium SB0661_bin_32]
MSTEMDALPAGESRESEAEGQMSLTPVWQESALQAGFVHDWLVAGPLATPISKIEGYTGPDYKSRIVADVRAAAAAGGTDPEGAIPASPEVFAGALERHSFVPDRDETKWRVVRCLDDHFVDLSTFHHTPHYLQAWAFCVLDVSNACEVTFSLTTNGPADIWVNGEQCRRVEHFRHQLPETVSFPAKLKEGRNEVGVCFEAVALRECPYVMALQLTGQEDGGGKLLDNIRVLLPTSVRPASRRQTLESIFDQAYLDRDIYSRHAKVTVRWPEGQAVTDDFALRLMRKGGRIYSEHHTKGETREEVVLGTAFQFPQDDYEVFLFPNPEHYYVNDLRVERRLDVHIVGNSEYSTERYGTYPQRRREALLNAARRGAEGSIFAEIAAMELGMWDNLNEQVILDCIASINERADCSDFDLVGLLGMAGRYIEEEGFPQSLVEPLQNCFQGFRYWMDQPGADAMCFWSENHQILFHTCEILAGQLLPDELFTNAGLTGSEHRAKGEERALSWLRKRAAGGFREWDSNTYYEEDVLALSHLVDLAENDDVRELAAVVLDKMFFGLAVNSFKGVFGSSHGRTYAPFIKDAFREPTSGITRLLWGKGIFNRCIRGTVSLACAVNYQLPPVIEAIAIDPADEIWSRERHAGQLEAWCDREEGAWEVNKVTHKTPDYMLCSAQDFRPGESGYQQHIWQATFSPEAVVFVTHPPCLSEDGSHRPNFWHGNVVLPRAAQWKDLLVAVHRLPEDDWLGFTHAYFPTFAFDEHEIRAGWACARVGDGYLAITASAGLTLTETGRSAFRELRSYGQNNIWVVQMGRAETDGSFAEFVEKVTALDVTFGEDSVHLTSLRGESIDFGWEGPLLVNEKEEPVSGFLHFDNPYSSTELGSEKMSIQFMDLLMQLDFS